MNLMLLIRQYLIQLLHTPYRYHPDVSCSFSLAQDTHLMPYKLHPDLCPPLPSFLFLYHVVAFGDQFLLLEQNLCSRGKVLERI